jgi:hypothetical protein
MILLAERPIAVVIEESVFPQMKKDDNGDYFLDLAPCDFFVCIVEKFLK